MVLRAGHRDRGHRRGRGKETGRPEIPTSTSLQEAGCRKGAADKPRKQEETQAPGLEEKKGNSRKKDGQQSPTLASKTRPGRRALDAPTVITVILKSLVTLGEGVLVV